MQATLNVVPVLATATPIASASDDRESLVFYPHNVRGFVLNNLPLPSTTQGVFLPAGRYPVYLNRKKHGSVVRKPWWAIASVADAQIGVQEAFAADDNMGANRGKRAMRMDLLSNIVVAQLSTSSLPVIGPSRDRWSIIFFPNSTGSVYLTINPPAVVGFGVSMFANQVPIYLDYETHGDIVQKAWYAISSAGSPTLGIIECLVRGG